MGLLQNYLASFLFPALNLSLLQSYLLLKVSTNSIKV